MNLLWVVTKSPWPPIDGGRVVVGTTLEALRARGHTVDLVAPYDAGTVDPRALAERLTPLCRPHLAPTVKHARLASALASLWTRTPFSIVRHRQAAVRATVAELLRHRAFDVVHAEQLQALAQCAPATARGVPIVLRCQNVESDLWLGAAAVGALRGALARREAARLAAFEGRALHRVAATIALTAHDAARLRTLAGDNLEIAHVAAPFPAELPPGAPLDAPSPVVAVLGSTGWRPNEDGIAWLVTEVWPRVRAQLPAASLHVFGAFDATTTTAPGVVRHAAPPDSSAAFPRGAICAVPLRYGSGVRMRILEAWARGIAVIATPEAARGLDARDGHELLIAGSAAEFAAAVRKLAADRDACAALIAAGRARLRSAHDPQTVAARLEQIYLQAARRR